MKRERVNKKQKRFQVINTVIISLIICFYLGRMFYYMIYFDKQREEASKYAEKYFYQILEASSKDPSSGAYVDNDGNYTYKGKDINNYVIYSNQLFRIISVSKDGVVKLIADEVVTSMNFDGTNKYRESNIYKFLNDVPGNPNTGKYVNILSQVGKYLVKYSVNEAVVNDLNNITSEASGEVLIGLPSLEEYLGSQGSFGFMNNGEGFWTSNTNSDGAHYYIDKNGDVGVSSSISTNKGIKPVITLNYGIKCNDGNGAKDTPYVIEESIKKDKVSTLQMGDYVSYSNMIWRVNNIDGNGNAILVLNDVIKVDGKELKIEYGSSNVYSPKGDDTLGRYLRKTFSQNLKDYENVLVKNTWYCGAYKDYAVDASYSFLYNYTDSYESYVSIVNASYFFMDECKNVFTNTYATTTKRTIFIYDENGNLFSDNLTEKHCVKPVICMKGENQITSGLGSIDSPFVIGG